MLYYEWVVVMTILKGEVLAMNKKISRLLAPGFRLSILIAIFIVATTAFVDITFALYQSGIVLVLSIFAKIISLRQKKRLLRYVEEVTYSVDSARSENFLNFPLPMLIFCIDTGKIVWFN